jgi:hypothetical protein
LVKDKFKGHFWSVAKVELRFGYAKQSKNLEWCLIHMLRQTISRPNIWKEKDAICTTSYFIGSGDSLENWRKIKHVKEFKWKEGY